MREYLAATIICWPGRREEIESFMAIERGIETRIREIKLPRSRKQENYYRKMLHHLGNHIGLTPREADGDLHDHMLCIAFGEEKTVKFPNGMVKAYPKKRSGDTSQDEYGFLIEVLLMVAAELGVFIPDPR